MQKIRFNNSIDIYDVKLDLYDANRIKCRFYSDLNTKYIVNIRSGFKELNENNLKVQGDFSKMKYIYRKLDDETFIFTSDKDDIYIEPESNNTDESTVTESQTNVPTLEESKHNKIVELSSACNNSIINGVDIIIDGKNDHFSYKKEDQINIKDLFDIATKLNTPVYYHADGAGYKPYTVEEITSLYYTETINKINHMAYFNQLKMYVESLDNMGKVNEVYYGQELTGEYLKIYNDAIRQTTKNIDKIISKT